MNAIYDLWGALGVIVLAVGIYALIARRLADFAQPLRLKLARDTTNLLADGTLSKREMSSVKWMRANAFSGHVMLLTAILLPFIWPISALMALRESSRSHNRQTDNALGRLSVLFAVSAFAANPIFGLVVVVEAAVFLLCLMLFTSPYVVQRVIMLVLEREASLLHWRMKGAH